MYSRSAGGEHFVIPRSFQLTLVLLVCGPKSENHCEEKRPIKKSRRIIHHCVDSSYLISGQWDFWDSIFLLPFSVFIFFPVTEYSHYHQKK